MIVYHTNLWTDSLETLFPKSGIYKHSKFLQKERISIKFIVASLTIKPIADSDIIKVR